MFSQLVTEDNNNVLPFLLNWKHISRRRKEETKGGRCLSVFWISTYFNREEAHQAKSQEYEFGIRLLKDENDADNGPKVVAKLFKCLSHGDDIKDERFRKQVCSPTNPFLESFCSPWRHNQIIPGFLKGIVEKFKAGPKKLKVAQSTFRQKKIKEI